MKISVEYIDLMKHAEDFKYMWVTVSFEDDNESGPIKSCEVKVPIEKQDITLAHLEELAIKNAKAFLASAI